MKHILGIALAMFVSVYAFGQEERANYKETAFGVEIPMVYVEGGEFVMGGTSEQGKDADKDEVIHRVTVKSFYIGQFEITQSQWEAVMETSVMDQSRKADAKLTLDKLNGVGPDYPMYYITWEEAMEFCRILSKKTEVFSSYRSRMGICSQRRLKDRCKVTHQVLRKQSCRQGCMV